MAVVTRSRVRSLLSSFEQIWLYSTLFVLLTGQLMLMEYLAQQQALELTSIQWVYEAVLSGFVIVLAGRLVVSWLPARADTGGEDQSTGA